MKVSMHTVSYAKNPRGGSETQLKTTRGLQVFNSQITSRDDARCRTKELMLTEDEIENLSREHDWTVKPIRKKKTAGTEETEKS